MATYIEMKHKESGDTVSTGNLSDEQAVSQLEILSREYGEDYTFTIVFDSTIEDGN